MSKNIYNFIYNRNRRERKLCLSFLRIMDMASTFFIVAVFPFSLFIIYLTHWNKSTASTISGTRGVYCMQL